MTNKMRVTRSFSYHVLCDVCGFRYWNHEVKQRWDGLMVCKWDWETRHPSDFYRTRNDAHKLPFIRSDTPADPRSTYVPTITNITYNQLDGETGTTISISSPTAYYLANPDTVITTVVVDLRFTKPSPSDATFTYVVREASSTTSGSSATISMPTVPTTAGNYTIINDRGEVIKSGTVPAGNVTVQLGSWNAKRGGITITAKYGT